MNVHGELGPKLEPHAFARTTTTDADVVTVGVM